MINRDSMITNTHGNVQNVVIRIVYLQMIFTNLKKILETMVNREVKIMQMCPYCDKVYDESEYVHCPYCSGELEEDDEEIRPCPECGGCLHFDGYDRWECSNCDYSEED